MEGRGKKAVTVIFENQKKFCFLIEKLISLSGELL